MNKNKILHCRCTQINWNGKELVDFLFSWNFHRFFRLPLISSDLWCSYGLYTTQCLSCLPFASDKFDTEKRKTCDCCSNSCHFFVPVPHVQSRNGVRSHCITRFLFFFQIYVYNFEWWKMPCQHYIHTKCVHQPWYVRQRFHAWQNVDREKKAQRRLQSQHVLQKFV